MSWTHPSSPAISNFTPRHGMVSFLCGLNSMDAEKVSTFLKDLSIWGKKISFKGVLEAAALKNLTKTDAAGHWIVPMVSFNGESKGKKWRTAQINHRCPLIKRENVKAPKLIVEIAKKWTQRLKFYSSLRGRYFWINLIGTLDSPFFSFLRVNYSV